ncbi:hypothetical protein [Burkholderia sp. SCN-KJ]|uniref:hypothetical protein n=1 Tax=Burkholderia sp. SCN-KJ TaxID=2969248 RepID=UPI002150655A|nr:hypothetical protein [Burkholderia sp. SCN-KJ]MCR4471381.1 hypothetical protein [Burkholderia sp. SCN-KJ]
MKRPRKIDRFCGAFLRHATWNQIALAALFPASATDPGNGPVAARLFRAPVTPARPLEALERRPDIDVFVTAYQTDSVWLPIARRFEDVLSVSIGFDSILLIRLAVR